MKANNARANVAQTVSDRISRRNSVEQIKAEYSKVLQFEATATAHATGLTPPATHLTVRRDERRLASAPGRAVPSHGHIEHQLN
jgi:hypothetical protein